MKKLILAALVFAMGAPAVNAQIADGSVLTQNIIITDLDGTEHDIFSYLDQGKTVIFDLFAEWCGPCWNYHNTGTGHPNGGALKTVWNNYGPDGTDEVIVIAVETDNSTPEALMYGGAGTNGWDWVTNTPYPMANADIGGIFQQGYYPYIIRICPNRQIFELGQQSASAIYADVNTCLSPQGANNGALLGYSGETEGCEVVELKVNMQNLGSNNLTAATITATSGANVLAVYQWSGNLAPFAIIEVVIGEVALSSSSDVTFAITSADDFAGDNTTNATLIPGVQSSSSLEVKVITDNYGNEVYWRIISEGGALIAQGGNQGVGTNGGGGVTPPNGQGAYANNQTNTVNVNLPSNGCYSFEIYDYFGDGICCQYGQGSYSVKDLASNQVLFSGGDFGTDEKKKVITSVVGIEEATSLTGFNIYPNPTRNDLNIQFDLAEAQHVSVDVHDILGKLIKSFDYGMLSGTNLRMINMDSENEGMYMLVMNIGEQRSVKKFTLAK